MGGRAKQIVRFFWGGGERATERALQNQVWRLQKVVLSGLCPFPVRKDDRAWTNGGGERILGGGGSKTGFGGGVLWYVFPSPGFPHLPCFSLSCLLISFSLIF